MKGNTLPGQSKLQHPGLDELVGKDWTEMIRILAVFLLAALLPALPMLAVFDRRAAGDELTAAIKLAVVTNGVTTTRDGRIAI
jgi:hypothetical protein